MFDTVITSIPLYQLPYQNFNILKYIIITVLEISIYQNLAYRQISLVQYGNGALPKIIFSKNHQTLTSWAEFSPQVVILLAIYFKEMSK